MKKLGFLKKYILSASYKEKKKKTRDASIQPLPL